MPLQGYRQSRRNEGDKHNEEYGEPETGGAGGERKQGGFWRTDYDASGVPVQTGVYVYEERAGCLGCCTGVRNARNDLHG